MLDALPTNALVVTAEVQNNYVRYEVMADAAADSPIVRTTRFSELSALHNAITKELPHFQGELPRKTFRPCAWKGEAFIEGRRADIERYLREAATHARQSTSFREFFASGLTDTESEAVDAEVSVSTAMPVPFALRPSVGTWLTQPSLRARCARDHGANENASDAAGSNLHSACIAAISSLPVPSPTPSLAVKAVTQHDVVMYEVMVDSSPDSRGLKSTRYSELSELHNSSKKEIPDFPGKARTDARAIDVHAALPTASLIVKARIEQNLVKYDVLADASEGSPILKSTRFSELSILHSMLKKELEAFTWKLPRKTVRQHRDAAFIEGRRANIELYLRRVAAHSWQSKAFRAFFKECDDAVHKTIRLLKAAVIFAEQAHATASELNDSAATAANAAIEYSSQLTMGADKAMKDLLSIEGRANELSTDLDRVTHAHHAAEVKARQAHAAWVDHERDAERTAEIMAEANTEMTTIATKQLKLRTATNKSHAIFLKGAAEEASVEVEQNADKVASAKALLEECTLGRHLASAVHARAAAAAQDAAREVEILKERSEQCAATLESRLAELTAAKQAVLAAQKRHGVQVFQKTSPDLSEDTTDSAVSTSDSGWTSEWSSDVVTSHLDEPAPLDACGLAALAL
jgi:hypothetical protein